MYIVHLHEAKNCTVYSILGLYIHLLAGKGVYIVMLHAKKDRPTHIWHICKPKPASRRFCLQKSQILPNHIKDIVNNRLNCMILKLN